MVMFGLLSGILVSRSISGSIAQHFGWRTVYWLAAAAMVVTATVLACALPRAERKYTGSYRGLMRSLWTLVREEQLIRRTSAIGALQFAGFSAFWTTLAFQLHTLNAHYGSEVAGLFGLVGVGGALASMAAGRLTDSRDPRQVVAVGSAIYVASFAVFALAGHTIAGLIAGVFLLDLGVQSGHVSNMALNMSVRGGAMSRINTIYMASRFGGGALGSSLGIWAWSLWHWPGVCGVGLLVGCASLILQVGRRSKSLREARVD